MLGDEKEERRRKQKEEEEEEKQQPQHEFCEKVQAGRMSNRSNVRALFFFHVDGIFVVVETR